jgi:hypothetical protein
MPPLESGGAEAEVSRILTERVERLRSGLEALTRECLEHLPLPVTSGRPGEASSTAPADRVDSDFLSESVQALAASEDQISLLDRLLEGASRCFSRVCLFIVREDEAHGWSSVGLPETEQGDPAKGLVVSLGEDSILRAAVESREPVRRELSSDELRFLPAHRPGDRLPGVALAAPLKVLDKVAAVLYADDGGDGRIAHDPGCVEVLSSVAALAASRLALLSRPPGVEVEASADLHVQVPRAEEGGGLVADPALFDADPLDDEMTSDLPAAAPPAGLENLSPEERLLHEDARRFARLLISELLLYNEDLVILGRKQRDIYSRLKDEIDRSRQAYEQRVPRNVSARTDYFREEMVRTLAGGDSTALGPGLAS